MESRLKPTHNRTPQANPSAELSEGWIAYQHCVSREPFPPGLDLAECWRGQSVRFPRVAGVALPYISVPVSPVDRERGFSKYKTPLTEQEALTELNTKRLTIMYFNRVVSIRGKL